MGIGEDILSALNDWFEGVLADGIIGSLKTTNDMLSNTLNGTGGHKMNPLFEMFLSSPDKFTGTEDGSGTPVWNAIHTISNNFIVPIGGVILAIVLVYELIQMISKGNNFHDFDTSIFIRWVIKAFVGVLLISNVYDITSVIFSLGTGTVSDALGSLFPNGNFVDSNLFGNDAAIQSLRQSLIDNENIGTLIITLILAFVLIIVAFVLLAAIVIVLASRMIEIFMYLGISPIPMATFMNDEWSQMGKNWFKNILALAFQGFFIVIGLSVFKSLFNNALGSLATSSNIVTSMAVLLGFVLALIFTMFRTSQISKSVFAAH